VFLYAAAALVCNRVMWSRRRRPSFARRRFRESLRAFLLRNWVRLSGVAVFFVAIGVVESVLLDGYALGLVHGVLLVAGPAMVLVLFMAHTGAIWQFAGFVGEDNTRDELKKAVTRRYIWGWVDNIEVSDGDIDHLIIAPAGVFAVDSKWHARKLNSSLLAKDVRSATIAAAKARSVLRSIKRPLDVHPVVVVWGAGEKDVPAGGGLIDGVGVVAGHEIAAWLQRYSTALSVATSREGFSPNLRLSELESIQRGKPASGPDHLEAGQPEFGAPQDPSAARECVLMGMRRQVGPNSVVLACCQALHG
jgi:hypothetical protein